MRVQVRLVTHDFRCQAGGTSPWVTTVPEERDQFWGRAGPVLKVPLREQDLQL